MYYTALLGNPVDHSVSPVLFEYFARLCGIEYRHLKINVEPDRLDAALRAARELGFCGLNITLPFKQDVGQYLDSLDKAVTSCGAVNTVAFRDGQAIGLNTDWRGIIEGFKTQGIDTCSRAAVFGSGGAARAAIYALKQMGCQSVHVFYRQPADKKTKDLLLEAKALDITMHPYDELEKVLPGMEVICNMSSAGMVGQDETPFDLNRLDSMDLHVRAFLDAVFNPVQTPLLGYFKTNHVPAIDGLWMMIFQGVTAFEEWTGKSVKLTELQKEEIHTLLEKEVADDSTRH